MTLSRRAFLGGGVALAGSAALGWRAVSGGGGGPAQAAGGAGDRAAVLRGYDRMCADLAGNYFTAGMPEIGRPATILPANSDGTSGNAGTPAYVVNYHDGELWMIAQYGNFLYADWKLRGKDAAAARRLGQWLAVLKATFPTTDAHHGLGSDGAGDGTVDVSDDASWKHLVLMELHEVTGDASLLPLLRSSIIGVNLRYKDSYTPANLIRSGPLLYSKYGMLYATPDEDPGGQGRSTTYEVPTLLASLYLYQQGGEPCFLDYPRTVYASFKDHLQYQGGIYYQSLQLDPRATHDPSAYLQPIEVGRGLPKQGNTGFTIGGTMGMAVLAARLFRITGDDQYRRDALAVVDGMARHYLQDGKIINDRDPWTNGWPAYLFASEVLTVRGADPDGAIRRALVATARQILSTRTPIVLKDWSGRDYPGFGYSAEWSANTLPTVFGEVTWEAHSIHDAGGDVVHASGPARPNQIMTNASSGSMVQAAVQVVRAG